MLALSPGAKTLAFVGVQNRTSQLFVHRLDQRGVTTVVPNSDEAEGPFFSPDGERVAFAVGVSQAGGKKGELKKYSLATGLTQPICDIADFFGGAWRADGFFYGANGAPIQRVSAAGGKAEPAVSAFRRNGKDVDTPAYWPQFISDNTVLVQADGPDGDPQPSLLDLQTGELTSLGITGLHPRYASTGHILYLREDATLMAVPFDAKRGCDHRRRGRHTGRHQRDGKR